MPGIGRSLSAALRAFAHPNETYDLESRARRAERSASHAADAYRTEKAHRMHAQREAALVGYRVGYGEGAGDTRDRARRSRQVGYRRGYETRAVEDRERVDDVIYGSGGSSRSSDRGAVGVKVYPAMRVLLQAATQGDSVWPSRMCRDVLRLNSRRETEVSRGEGIRRRRSGTQILGVAVLGRRRGEDNES
ncbi:MAG: hypothetical protein Q9193_006881, partial [Seirophora villosa]